MDPNLPTQTSGHPKVLLASLGILVLCVISLIAVVLWPTTKGQDQSAKQSAVPTPLAKQTATTTAKPAPQVYFDTYVANAKLPSVSETPNTYAIKSSFSSQDVNTFAQKFGLLTVQPTTGQTALVYNMTDGNKRGILQFHSTTGAFTYQGYGSFKPQGYTAGQSFIKEAQDFLQDLGFSDGAVTCGVSYERKDLPTITFVECHRDWAVVGLPILNLVGIVNLAEDKKVTALRLGVADANIRDSQIIKVNTGENGQARPSDFNTITFGFRPDGSVQSATSTLRWVTNSKPVNDIEFLSPTEARDLFTKHAASFSLTIPSGSGTVDWDKVYPGNTATAKLATIDDFALVYTEKLQPASQKSYTPTYIIRGTATLNSGYTVRFIQSIPAVKTELAAAPVREVAGASVHLAVQDRLQIDTFTPTTPTPVEPTNTPVPTQEPVATPTPADPISCTAGTGQQTFSIDGVLVSAGGWGYHTVYLAQDSTESMAAIKQKLHNALADQYAINVAKWILQHSGVFGGQQPNIHTREAALELFSQMNGNNPSCSSGDAPAPIVACGEGTNNLADGGYSYVYNQAAAVEIADKVADQIIAANGAQQTLTQLASKQNIFPSQQYMQWVLLEGQAYGNVYGNGACYISGISPTLYFYTQDAKNITVTSGAPLTYADPKTVGSTWNIVALPNGMLQTPEPRSSLYYEYNPTVKINVATAGYITTRENVTAFVKSTLAAKLGLNEKEAATLRTEVKNALTGVSLPYVKISLAAAEEVNMKLPLAISPVPDHLYRVHVVLTPLYQKEFLPEPMLSPITHDSFTVVELGARVN